MEKEAGGVAIGAGGGHGSGWGEGRARRLRDIEKVDRTS